MSIISIPWTFTVGAIIVASQHNSNFSVIYSDYNGSIDNTNITALAAIADTKLAQIVTAGKVSGAAFTSLTSVPAGAGLMPVANIDTGTTANKILILNGSSQIPAVSGALLTNLTATVAGIKDYATSASSSTARAQALLLIAYGNSISVSGGSSAAVTNLSFTSATSYTVIVSAISSFGTPPSSTDQNAGNLVAVMNSGSQFTIYNTDDQTKTVNWLAIGT